MIFGNQQTKELEDWQNEHVKITLLQYVDGILLATETQEEATTLTLNLLNFLGQAGYKISRRKAQVACQEVSGIHLDEGSKAWGQKERKLFVKYQILSLSTNSMPFLEWLDGVAFGL
ncbi:hypothetical protein BTVI_06476 [Pitangus sulphuratus]|nr:hypothetical protein BTVI_06476 [Pitangus sulphuratus]